MSECIAMTIGFVLGAGCVLVTGKIIVAPSQSPDGDSSPGGEGGGLASHSGRGAEGRGGEGEREKLVKQWENFLNYDGTGKGQVSIEDGEGQCRRL